MFNIISIVVQSPSHVRLFETPWTAVHQASLSPTISQSLLKLMSIESVMPCKHLVLCCPLLLCAQSFPVSGFFPMSWLFASGDQNIGASALTLVLLMSIHGWFPIRLTGWSLWCQRDSQRVVSSTTVWRHRFFRALSSSPSSSHNCIWPLERPHSLGYKGLCRQSDVSAFQHTV